MTSASLLIDTHLQESVGELADEAHLSLTPNFSWVSANRECEEPFQRFSLAEINQPTKQPEYSCDLSVRAVTLNETVETVPGSHDAAHTQLKLGVNEKEILESIAPPRFESYALPVVVADVHATCPRILRISLSPQWSSPGATARGSPRRAVPRRRVSSSLR
jgi:hypothetical protein